MSQLNNNCESGTSRFEALPSALKENKRQRVCRLPPRCVCVCLCVSFEADHLEESGFGNAIFLTEWTCAVSLEEVIKDTVIFSF